MNKEEYNGNILKSSKYNNKPAAVAGMYQGAVENAVNVERIAKFNAAQGQGFAAEQANNFIDKNHGRDAVILGDNNAKDGADRVVNKVLIQTKYCQSASASVDAAFRNGQYRYIDANGHPMQLEVPSDQYEQAVDFMRRRIAKGQVSGVTNPNDAEKLVRRGNVDYKTACRIAKAGNIDSLMFDAANGTVVATGAFGISAAIVFAKEMWSGESTEKAMDLAIYNGLKTGGVVFASSVLAAQLTRTGLNNALITPSIELVKLLPSSVRHSLVNSLNEGPLIYGGAANNNLAKLVRGNIISAGAIVLVMSATDIVDFFNNRISAKQMFKNITTIASGIGGGYVGSAVGGAIGTVLAPGIGTKVGAIAGGLLGSTVAGETANSLLSTMIEDDVAEMLRIINERFVPLVREYMLSEEEMEIVVDELKYELSHNKLLDMFSSKDREAFADDLLTEVIEKTVKWRVSIHIPDDKEFTKSLGRVFELSQDIDKLQAYVSHKKVDTQKLGEKLLGRQLSEFSSKKAWYVTKQMNTISMAHEKCLLQMSEAEKSFQAKSKQDDDRLIQVKKEFNDLIGG